jgi:hypothetical protein
MASNRRWRLQFRYRGSRRESAVAQLFSLGGIEFMSISKRRRLGLLLTVIAVLAGIVYLVDDVSYGLTNGHPQFGPVQTSRTLFGTATSQSVMLDASISGYYLIPIILCGAVGLFYLAWPSRKPPKLTK